jgi:hypothetical protein
MLKHAFLAAICLCCLALTVPAMAHQSATVTLRSGERINGEVVDYGGVGFSVSVNGQMRQIPAREVASVEFGGGRGLSAEQQLKSSLGQSFVVLSNGQTIDGGLYDIGGTRPLRITIDTSSGRRDFTSNEVAGIYFANPSRSGATATGGVQQGGLGSIVVTGNRQWTPTNIRVNAGESLRVQTSGEIRFTRSANSRTGPGGLAGSLVPGSPLPQAFGGSLIGRIDGGQPFLIGNQSSVVMPGSGLLMLGINDDNTSDNAGQFNVIITR